jgi:hypothetical protein
MHREWFPFKDLIHTGRLCSGGFACQAFPTFIARIRPSDSLIPYHLAAVVPRFGGTRAPHASSLRGLCPAGSSCAWQTASASEIGHRVSVAPVVFTSEIRVSQVPGSSSSHAPWSTTPPGPPFLPIADSVMLSSRFEILWTPDVSNFSGLHSHGSHVRVPTLRRTRHRDRRKARYRLVRVHLAGRVSHPLNDDSEFQEVIASSHPF